MFYFFILAPMILVTGASGLVGSHLLIKLALEGEKIRALYRREESLEEVKNVFSFYTDRYEELFNSIEWFKADILDIPQLEEAFEGVKKVYHIAAMVSFDPKDEKRMLETNVSGSANVVNLSIDKKIEKLCHVSSIATLSKTIGKELIDENDLWNPDDNNNVYAISKNGAEMEVWRGIEEGLDAVIVNPSVIIGPGFWSNSSGQLFSRIYGGLKFKTTGGSGFVSAKDVASAMYQLMESNISKERFVLNSENLSFSEIFGFIASSLNVKAPSINIGRGLLTSISKIDAIFSFFFSTKRKITSDNVRSAFKRSHYSSEKIQNTLSFKFERIEDSVKFASSKFLINKK